MFEDQSGNPATNTTSGGKPYGGGAHGGNDGFTLTSARDGDHLRIVSMQGGRTFRRQLMDMGLHPGMGIRVMRAGGHGPVLISAGDTRLGIGRGMAEKINVVAAGTAKDQ